MINFSKARAGDYNMRERKNNMVDRISELPGEILVDYNMRKRKRKGSTMCNIKDTVDRISELPDEILAKILCFLPLKEAQATSILSRRWRYLWTCIVSLNFEDEKIVLFSFDHLKNLPKIYNPNKDDQAIQLKEVGRYTDWVNSVMEHHQGLRINRFRVSFKMHDIGGKISKCVDRWVQFAMEKGVEVLELDLIYVRLLTNFTLYHPSLSTGFKSLKVLGLKHVSVDGEVLEYLLSNCQVIERLSVCCCRNLVNLRIVSPPTTLKYLVIERCMSIKSIEIHNADLVSFAYSTGQEVNMILRNVPLLVEVSIWNQAYIQTPFTQLSCCVSQLQILRIEITASMFGNDYVFPIFRNLKHLELTFSDVDDYALFRLSSFIEASPNLYKLMLEFAYATVKRTQKFKTEKCFHHHLKVVEIIGYLGRISDCHLVGFLAKTAAELEEIIISPYESWYGTEEKARDIKARKKNLGKIVPSSVNLVYL